MDRRLAVALVGVLVFALGLMTSQVLVILMAGRIPPPFMSEWIGDLINLVVAAALIGAAVYAKEAFDAARRGERMRLTVSVMEAAYTTTAVETVSKILASAKGNLAQARADAAAAAATIPPSSEVNQVIGAYCYIATLYAKGLLDQELIMTQASTIAFGFYIIDPLVRPRILLKLISASVLDLARDAVKHCDPNLRGTIGLGGYTV
jgi:hypothetical protein